MKEDERKSRLHIHLGGLVILIIIFLLLLKVDLRSTIKSPQFQENYIYITEQVTIFWQKYISTPIKTKIGTWFVEITNKELNKIQNSFADKILKTPNTDEEKIKE